MRFFEYLDYKRFLKDYLLSMPRNGYGQAKRLSDYLGVSSVAVSQVLSGDKHFTPEQGLQVCEFFGFDEQTTEYLLLLLSKERAGSEKLTKYYLEQIKTKQNTLKSIKSHVVASQDLTEEQKAIYYSNWYYSGIRLLTSIEGFNSIDVIAERFGLTRRKVAQVLKFLVEHGLCVEDNGKTKLATASIYLSPNSVHINNHRRNWRVKGLEKLTEPNDDEIFFSNPCSLSESDFLEIKSQLTKTIGEISKRIQDSPEEKLACLNIDWFKV